MKWILLVVLVGCGGASEQPFTDPQPVACASTDSGNVDAAVAWRDAAVAACERGEGIAVARPWPSLQIVCCSSLTADGDWCWSDQISAADHYDCCEPAAYTGQCFEVR